MYMEELKDKDYLLDWAQGYKQGNRQLNRSPWIYIHSSAVPNHVPSPFAHIPRQDKQAGAQELAEQFFLCCASEHCNKQNPPFTLNGK